MNWEVILNLLLLLDCTKHICSLNFSFWSFKLWVSLAEFFEITNALNEKYGYNAVETKITYSYQNMKEKVNEKPYVLEYPVEALKSLGYTPTFIPIRGGTDGARLSFNGIVCPNLGTGGDSCHGPYEYVDVDEMKVMVRVLHNLLTIISEN